MAAKLCVACFFLEGHFLKLYKLDMIYWLKIIPSQKKGKVGKVPSTTGCSALIWSKQPRGETSFGSCHQAPGWMLSTVEMLVEKKYGWMVEEEVFWWKLFVSNLVFKSGTVFLKFEQAKQVKLIFHEALELICWFIAVDGANPACGS